MLKEQGPSSYFLNYYYCYFTLSEVRKLGQRLLLKKVLSQQARLHQNISLLSSNKKTLNTNKYLK